MSTHATVKRSKDLQWYTTVKAANGEPIGHTETYANEEDAVHAAELLGVERENIVIIYSS